VRFDYLCGVRASTRLGADAEAAEAHPAATAATERTSVKALGPTGTEAYLLGIVVHAPPPLTSGVEPCSVTVAAAGWMADLRTRGYRGSSPAGDILDTIETRFELSLA
jgi:hypothetical protein